jgi:hypothetical protein
MPNIKRAFLGPNSSDDFLSDLTGSTSKFGISVSVSRAKNKIRRLMIFAN